MAAGEAFWQSLSGGGGGSSVTAGADVQSVAHSLAAGAWEAVTGVEVPLAASAGDKLLLFGHFNFLGSDGNNVYGDFGIAGTRIGDSTIGSGRLGAPNGGEHVLGGMVHNLHTVVSGDISGGNVTVTLFVFNSGGHDPTKCRLTAVNLG
jgi:hypothetical protein